MIKDATLATYMAYKMNLVKNFFGTSYRTWSMQCWILMGDFNVVRVKDERRGSVFCKRSARYFNEFISNADLFDLVLGGRKFTWSTLKVRNSVNWTDFLSRPASPLNGTVPTQLHFLETLRTIAPYCFGLLLLTLCLYLLNFLTSSSLILISTV